MTAILLFFFSYSNHESCLKPQLAQRLGIENCWAQFEIHSDRRVCINQHSWIEWLNSKQALWFCRDPHRKTKISSPLKNSISHTNDKKSHLTEYWKPILIDGPRNKSFNFNNYFWKNIEKQREIISQLLTPDDSLGLLRKLILNESIRDGSLPLLRKFGFVHLATATGIHFYALLRWWEEAAKVICQSSKIPIRIGLTFSRVASFVSIFSIWLLSGAKLGMLRPWIILCAREIAKLLGFRWFKASPLLIALFADFGVAFYRFHLNQENAFHSGRWIYTLAVGGGLLWSKIFRSTHLSLAIGSWLGVAIWEIWKTGSVALATPILSLITLPFICLVVYPVLLFFIFIYELGFSTFGKNGIGWLTEMANLFILKLSKIALYTGNLWIIPQWAILSGILISFLILLTEPTLGLLSPTKKGFGLVLCLVILRFILRLDLFYLNSQNSVDAKSVEQLDVGQGDAALVIGQQIGLIDTGSQRMMSDSAWLELFNSRQIRKIHWVALTHLDEDHVGALLRLIRLIPIECIVTAEEELTTVRGRRLNQTLIQSGLKIKDWRSPCVPYPTLPPPELPFKTRNKKVRSNQNMGAVWIPLQNGGFYLSAGDAGAEDESRIGPWAAQLGQNRSHPRILKANHHGSASSNSLEFISKIRPTEIWISAGKGNRYGHPSPLILNRLNRLGITIKRTDRDGTLKIEHEFPKAAVVPHQ